MNTDVAGRVRNVQLPASKPLLPLFEAITNSIQAIEDAGENSGRIVIEVVRDASKLLPGSERHMADIVGFVVRDNGIGFTPENFNAFSTSDTTYKASRGGKGIGRFMWLAAFDLVEIDSLFGADGSTQRRRFTFCTRGAGIEKHTCTNDPGASRETLVRLIGFKEKYSRPCPKRPETIAAFIVEEFLDVFLGPSCPVITLSDDMTAQVIDLGDLFDAEVAAHSEHRSVDIKGQPFQVLHMRLYSTHIHEHRLYLCAHDRVVIREKLTGIPNLISRFKDADGKEFVYAAYVNSPALDTAVNADRTGFTIPEDGGELFPDEITMSDIRKSVRGTCAQHLAPYTAPVAQEKRERIQQFIDNEGAMYRPILKRLEAAIDRIDAEATNDEIDRHLYDAYHELQVSLRTEGRELLQSTDSEDAEFGQFKERFDDYFEKISEVNRSDLARYVCHRKAIIEFLQKQLALLDGGKYPREERIHSIVFPRGRSSDDLLFDDHNLWLIDERLAFHVFLSSDQSIKQAQPLKSKSKKEPDILVFGKAVAFSESLDVPFSSVTIIEFKKPQRKEYTENENPFVQVCKYIDEIRKGKALTSDGRPIPISPSLRFYCYIICDITPEVPPVFWTGG